MEELNKEALSLNAKLQQKKNKLRKLLKEKGTLVKDRQNEYDRYKYFSEAGYKKLFTELFSEAGLELKFTEDTYEFIDGTEKQHNGRMVKLVFTLMDIDTGYSEETVVSGEGLDKGDKAGYKAYTGALKYYLANTFMVATGDDPENESPEETTKKKTNKKQNVQKDVQLITPETLAVLSRQDDKVQKWALQLNHVNDLSQVPEEWAANVLEQMKAKGALK